MKKALLEPDPAPLLRVGFRTIRVMVCTTPSVPVVIWSEVTDAGCDVDADDEDGPAESVTISVDVGTATSDVWPAAFVVGDDAITVEV